MEDLEREVSWLHVHVWSQNNRVGLSFILLSIVRLLCDYFAIVQKHSR
jgi:hypothetical protein